MRWEYRPLNGSDGKPIDKRWGLFADGCLMAIYMGHKTLAFRFHFQRDQAMRMLEYVQKESQKKGWDVPVLISMPPSKEAIERHILAKSAGHGVANTNPIPPLLDKGGDEFQRILQSRQA